MARRVPPLAAAIVLVALGLLATAWSTRRTVNEAHDAVRDGQAFAMQQAVRADLADLGGPPGADDLAAILRVRGAEGLEYVAILDGRGRAQVSAGTPEVEPPPRERAPIKIARSGDRVRLETRSEFRRAWGPGRGVLWLAIEVEPVKAHQLRSASQRTLALGALGALVLLGVAGWLVRAELERRAREQERERERRLASLGEMSAVLAHEIRNPLASLKGNAQLLASSLPEGEAGSASAKARAKAERVVDEAVRLEKLTQDLLAFVRTGELVRSDVAPATLVRDAAVGFDGVTIDDSGAPASWSLDGSRMGEVLVNLIDNAVAAGAPVHVRVAGKRALTIEVSDSGAGVKPEERDKIFEPFFTGKTRGTGLGLAIARRIVEAHGGTIRVDDAPGGGALFRIEIPHGAHPGR